MIKNLIIIFLFSGLLSAQMKMDTLDIENYKLMKIKLPDKLKEVSTLGYHTEHFWSVNDSGGKAELYKINPENGKIVQTVKIVNAKNMDWEEITFGNKHAFIGDFGNNDGNRKDLTIYYFPLSVLETNDDEISVEAKSIEFHFPEQKDFALASNKTDFDCEAMFYYNGKLHLFTKEWLSQKTTHYTLEVKPGNQSAKKIETFPTNYLVTGATVDDNPISNTYGFYLIGYTRDGFSLISGFALPNKKDDILFPETTAKFSLPLGFVPQLGQTEGIAIKPESPNVLCFSAENFKKKEFHAEQNIQCIYSLAQ